VWSTSLGFDKPIQSYFSFSNKPKTKIVRLIESRYSVDLRSSGGDLEKSGPGSRVKADPARNARNTGGGLLLGSMKAFAEFPDSNNMAYKRVNFHK